MHWSEPATITEWFKRLFALRALLLALLMVVVVFTELRFDWVEQTVGAYLASTNAMRPKAGRVWKVGQEGFVARQTIDKVIASRQTSRRNADQADSFEQLKKTVLKDQGVMIAPEHFRRLYLNLPPEKARALVSPYMLLDLMATKNWHRTYCEDTANGLHFFFIDRNNQIINDVVITMEQLKTVALPEKAKPGRLEDLYFKPDRIYTAKHFFQVLKLMEPDTVKEAVPTPERLMETPGVLKRIGISDEAVNSEVAIGYEFETSAANRVYFISGQDWAVWQLRKRLETDSASDNEYVGEAP